MIKRRSVMIIAVLIAPLFYIISQYNSIFSLLLLEFLSGTIGVMIFTVALVSQRYSANAFMERYAYGLIEVAGLFFLHAITYKKMGVVTGYDTNLPTQFLLILSIMQAISLLVSIGLVNKKVNKWIIILGYQAFGFVFIYLSLLRVFPACYIEGEGFTLFFKIGEYIAIALNLIAIVLIHTKKIEKGLIPYTTAIFLFMVADIAYTLYYKEYLVQNFLGHYYQLIGLMILFRSIVVSNIQKPYDTVFHDLKVLSEKDGLTKLYNRNYLNEFLKVLEKTENLNIYMVLFDIDGFKRINDTYGHATGDIVLQEVSDIILNNVRLNDRAIRFGGDEFLIIFTQTSLEEAKKIWKRVNSQIVNNSFTAKQISVSVSAGFGHYDGDYEKTFKAIDSIVFEGKKNGKNQTRYSDE